MHDNPYFFEEILKSTFIESESGFCFFFYSLQTYIIDDCMDRVIFSYLHFPIYLLFLNCYLSVFYMPTDQDKDDWDGIKRFGYLRGMVIVVDLM